MGHRSTALRSRLAVVSMAVLFTVAACGSTPATSATPSTDPEGVQVTVGDIEFAELAAQAAEAAPEYAAIVQTLREAAGLIEALGPAGPSVYAFIDASQASALRDYVIEHFPQIASAGKVASAAGGVGPDPILQKDALPTVFMAWLVTSMVGTFPKHDSGDHGAGGLFKTDTTTFTSTEGGVTTSTEVTTDISGYSWDGNDRAVTVTIGHKTTVTDAGGKVTGHLTGTVTSTVEFQGCPASDGLIIGRIKFTVQEGSADAAVGGAFSKTSWEQNVHQYVGEDAWLTRQESAVTTDISVRGGIKSAGQAPDVANDWDAATGHTSNLVAKGPPTGLSGVPDWQADPARPGQATGTADFRTVADQAAADKVIKDAAAGGAFVTGLPLLFVTDSAQQYWRNDNCVEVAILEGSGAEVAPNQHVSIVAQPRHKIDRVDLKKPVVAAFSGKASAEPLGVAVPAPARFDYKAGEEEFDEGTVTLTSTSNRGIGTASVTFRVPQQETPSPEASASPACALKSCGKPGGTAYATDQALASRITGTITWQMTQDDPYSELGQSSSGSVDLILVSTNDFDFQVQSGSTYTYDADLTECGSATLSGTIEQNFAGGGNELREGVGQFMMTGGPGRNLRMSLNFSDTYKCTDGNPEFPPTAYPIGFPGCPFVGSAQGTYQGGSSDTYLFDCTMSGERGWTGTVQGTLHASP